MKKANRIIHAAGYFAEDCGIAAEKFFFHPMFAPMWSLVCGLVTLCLVPKAVQNGFSGALALLMAVAFLCIGAYGVYMVMQQAKLQPARIPVCSNDNQSPRARVEPETPWN